ncbi:MAG: hypothetical protein H7Z43_09805 [Clostridia bacterium]|nr:hypothetical protein [Deltaproteobacteria bacterium]
MSSELAWSEFLRKPSRIEPLLEKGDVVLRRRDGEPLRVSRAERGEEISEALATAARILAGSWSDEPRPSLEKRLDVQLPWTRFLPKVDRHVFGVAFLQQFEACADLGDFYALGHLLSEWKNTALLYAEGLASELNRPVVSVGSAVARPGR